MKRNDLLKALDDVIQSAKIYLNENEIPEARKALNDLIKTAERMNARDQVAEQDGNNKNRADQSAQQQTVDASTTDCDGD